MLVSGFNLEYSGFTNDGQNPAYTSSYELEITNLSDQPIQFEVIARVTRYAFAAFAPPTSPATILANLKQLIPGVIKNDLWTWFDSSWFQDADGFVLYVTIPVAPKTSELCGFGPSLYQNKSWAPRVAGHIELNIPAIRSEEPPYYWGPQADGPIPVMLNPSTVETWQVLHAGGLFADSRTSPPLATGTAYNEIQPETHPRIFFPVGDLTQKISGAAGITHAIAGLSPEERAQALIEMLAAVGDDDADQGAINDALEALGSSTRLKPRPRKTRREGHSPQQG
jgi:hypothetical protein